MPGCSLGAYINAGIAVIQAGEADHKDRAKAYFNSARELLQWKQDRASTMVRQPYASAQCVLLVSTCSNPTPPTLLAPTVHTPQLALLKATNLAHGFTPSEMALTIDGSASSSATPMTAESAFKDYVDVLKVTGVVGESLVCRLDCRC